MIRTFLVFSLLCSVFCGDWNPLNLNLLLLPGESYQFSDIKPSIGQPPFTNYSCAFHTIDYSQETSVLVEVSKGTGYVNGSPFEQVEITDFPIRRNFFSIVNILNLESIPGLLIKNQGNKGVNVNCDVYKGIDFFIPQGTEITMQDYKHLFCRLYTVGRNVPLEISIEGNGYIYWGGYRRNRVHMNNLDYVYVVDGSNTTFIIKNNGNADVDLLCYSPFA